MTRSFCALSLLAVALAGTGCRTRPAAGLGGFDCDPGTGVCNPRDGGPTDGDGGGVVTIQIKSPASPAYTNGSITIQIAFSPPSAAPASADLFSDGDATKLGTVTDPFMFVWDTGTAPAIAEGPHQIIARATVAGRTISSSPVTITVDRTPPEIANRLPSSGATNVLFAEPMQIQFSEAIDPDTLASAITLSADTGAISTSATLGADGKTVTIALADRHAITLPAAVTVSVQPTVADLAGNQLGSVPSWSWTAPLWVKLPMLAGKYPDLALGPDDRPIVLSAVEQDAIGSNDFVLQLGRLGSTRAWDTAIRSPQGDRPASRVSSRAALAVAPDGFPIVAWPESQATTPATIHVAKWTGSAWDQGYGYLDAVSGSGTNAIVPALAFSPSGSLFVSWSEPNPTATDVFTARWTGSAWDTSYGGVGVIGAFGPVIKFASNGQPVLSFTVSSTAGQVARWTGSAWSAAPTYTNRQAQSLALDATDRPVVVTWLGPATEQYLRLYFLNQGAWREEIPAIPTGLQPGDATLLIPADGHPIVTWTEFDTNAGARVVRVSRHDGVQWDFAYGSLDGSPGTNSDGVTPRMVLDKEGSPIVAWQETDGTFQSTYVWRSNH